MRRGRKAVPYVVPPDAPPLRDVLLDIRAKMATLNNIDSNISACIVKLEERLRALGVQRIFSVKLPDGADLGWSCRRHPRRWRFVIRTEDDALELLSCTREERVQVFACGAMEKLIHQAVL